MKKSVFRNQTFGERFEYYGPEHYGPDFDIDLLDEDTGLLRPGAAEWILKNKDCALRFLAHVECGEFVIHRQEYLLRLLWDIERKYSSVKYFPVVRERFDRTMESLGKNLKQFMLAQSATLTIDDEELSHTFGFGGGAGSVYYGVSVARTVAFQAMAQEFVDSYLLRKKMIDLSGNWHLRIYDPLDIKFSKAYEGIRIDPVNAKITKTGRKEWTLEFLDLPLCGNWYSCEEAAYRAARPLVAHTLAAKVEAVGVMD